MFRIVISLAAGSGEHITDINCIIIRAVCANGRAGCSFTFFISDRTTGLYWPTNKSAIITSSLDQLRRRQKSSYSI
jgi:hypothetical protein